MYTYSIPITHVIEGINTSDAGNNVVQCSDHFIRYNK